MNTIDTTLSDIDELRAESLAADDVAESFHATFDSNARDIMEPVRETLLESVNSCTPEEIVAQIIMEQLFAHPCDPESGGDITALTAENKVRLVRMANHMGPDWAQALYHAAVFITKVA